MSSFGLTRSVSSVERMSDKVSLIILMERSDIRINGDLNDCRFNLPVLTNELEILRALAGLENVSLRECK